MKRTDADYHVGNLFQSGNPLTGQRGTRLDHTWLNAVQEEIIGAIEGSGQAIDAARTDQLREAIRQGAGIRLKTLLTAQAVATEGRVGVGDLVHVLGHSIPGDGGGFTGVVEAADDADYPGGGRIRPADPLLTLEMWGVDTSGSVANQSLAMRAFFQFVGSSSSAALLRGTVRAQNIEIPDGVTIFSDGFTLVCPDDGTDLLTTTYSTDSYTFVTGFWTKDSQNIRVVGTIEVRSASGDADAAAAFSGLAVLGGNGSDFGSWRFTGTPLGVFAVSAEKARFNVLEGHNVWGRQVLDRDNAASTGGSILVMASCVGTKVDRVIGTNVYKPGVYLSVTTASVTSGIDNRDCHIGEIDIECADHPEAHGLAVRSGLDCSVGILRVLYGIHGVAVVRYDTDAGIEVKRCRIGRAVLSNIRQSTVPVSLVAAVYSNSNEVNVRYGPLVIDDLTLESCEQYGVWTSNSLPVVIGRLTVSGHGTAREVLAAQADSEIRVGYLEALKGIEDEIGVVVGNGVIDIDRLVLGPFAASGISGALYSQSADATIRIGEASLIGAGDGTDTHNTLYLANNVFADPANVHVGDVLVDDQNLSAYARSAAAEIIGYEGGTPFVATTPPPTGTWPDGYEIGVASTGKIYRRVSGAWKEISYVP